LTPAGRLFASIDETPASGNGPYFAVLDGA
jgi:hypothetical protein